MATKKTITKKKGKLSMQERYPMNIPENVFNAWQQLRRKGDPPLIASAINLSRPVIDKALNLGHVKNEKNTERISQFFQKRLDKERDAPVKIGKASKKLVEAVK